MYIQVFDSSPYDNNKERCLGTEKRDCLEIPNDRKKLWKPRNETVLSDEYYGDDQTTENEIEWTC
jgi:hypothetical protein